MVTADPQQEAVVRSCPVVRGSSQCPIRVPVGLLPSVAQPAAWAVCRSRDSPRSRWARFQQRCCRAEPIERCVSPAGDNLQQATARHGRGTGCTGGPRVIPTARGGTTSATRRQGCGPIRGLLTVIKGGLSRSWMAGMTPCRRGPCGSVRGAGGVVGWAWSVLRPWCSASGTCCRPAQRMRRPPPRQQLPQRQPPRRSRVKGPANRL